jgi:hypothetical protein
VIRDLSRKSHWCLSGGAEGADLFWGGIADRLGHGVIHYSFAGHDTAAPPKMIEHLTERQLALADPYCRQANQTLKRRFPAHSRKVTNLLRRNWYQVRVAQSCYAVSNFEKMPPTVIPLGTIVHGQIKGGTAWAVTMFIDQHYGHACPCFFFDQVLCYWFHWVGEGWQRIYEPPPPTRLYAGIGARDLLPMGKLAVKVLMKSNQPPDHEVARQQAETAARQRFEERARLLEGHKLGSWESLSDLMREALIQHELTRNNE